MELGLGCEVTGVADSDLCWTLLSISDRDDLKKALADSKLLGINLGFLPLTSSMSTQEPSISDCEHCLTVLASS